MIVVDPRCNVANCFVGTFSNAFSIAVAACRCRRNVPVIFGDRSLACRETRNLPSDLFLVSVCAIIVLVTYLYFVDIYQTFASSRYSEDRVDLLLTVVVAIRQRCLLKGE
jgi:hypothetical protein